MIAAVTDLAGQITGAHRTWLDGQVGTRRRSTRRGGRWAISSVTPSVSMWRMMSWRPVKASRPCCRSDASCPHADGRRALSAHLAAILFPATLRRLYIARDDDPAGDSAMASLIDRSSETGIEAITLSPRLGDFKRGSPDARHRCAAGRVAGADRSRGRRSLHGTGGVNRNGDEVRCGARLMSHWIVVLPCVVGEDRAHGLLRGRSGAAKRPGRQWRLATIFRRRQAALHREAK